MGSYNKKSKHFKTRAAPKRREVLFENVRRKPRTGRWDQPTWAFRTKERGQAKGFLRPLFEDQAWLYKPMKSENKGMSWRFKQWLRLPYFMSSYYSHPPAAFNNWRLTCQHPCEQEGYLLSKNLSPMESLLLLLFPSFYSKTTVYGYGSKIPGTPNKIWFGKFGKIDQNHPKPVVLFLTHFATYVSCCEDERYLAADFIEPHSGCRFHQDEMKKELQQLREKLVALEADKAGWFWVSVLEDFCSSTRNHLPVFSACWTV